MKKYEDLVVSVVSLMGDAYDVGFQQSKEIQSSAHLVQDELLLALSATCNAQEAQEALQYVSPNLLQEIKGLASGLEQSYESVIKMYSGYNMTFPDMGCTSFVHDGHYVRNYDFSPALYDARLVFSNPSEGYASIGFSQQIIGRLDGMNEKGLVVGLHFVNNEWEGDGFLASTIVRILLERCKNIEEAVLQLKKIPHRYCYNYSMIDQSGKVVVVEATPTEQIVFEKHSFMCTNHFESQELKEKNKASIDNSIQRKRYINHFVANACTTAMSAFQYFNDGDSPLFFKQYKEYFGTLHTVVYSPNQLEVIVGIGENSEPLTFSMHQFIRGELILPTTIKGKILQAI
ncbi:C45 family autoproteolytic acyltransferase/hydrolase [Lysinibacillus sp. NPDC093712]|uniref:C45 family autoproteolytic acyltransferase/hydolase n=1 Tax=Lysinibacillus sp. NPDC093712 TaxID=3390579 RepID=UPI003D009687